MIHLVSGVRLGGSYQFCTRLLSLLPLPNRVVSDRGELSDYDYQPRDILWFSHLLGTGIMLADIQCLVARHTFQKVVVNVHDLSLFHYFDFPRGLNNVQAYSTEVLPPTLSPSTKAFLDLVDVVICPSEWVRGLFLGSYSGNHGKFVVSAHPDVCHYERPVQWLRTRGEKVNLCIPHEISFLKGEQLLRRIAPLLNTLRNVRVFAYGNVEPTFYKCSVVQCGRYDDDEFYEWVERDNVHGFLLLNDHRETYSYCFSKCINTGLPCLYSDVDGAIGERVRQHSVQGMYPLHQNDMKRQIDRFVSDLVTNGTVYHRPPPPGKTLTVPDVYHTIFEQA